MSTRIATSLVFVVAALGFASEARAERRDCEVVFVRAPDDVRLVIETWLKAEPRCSGTIELRVVETETGSLYLIAQRPDGRIHEREVPDAQSAGVLVASWVADDWTSSPPVDEPEAPPAPEPLTVNPFAGAPGVTDTLPTLQPRTTGRWLGASGMIAMHDQGGAGLRLEMDLFGGRDNKWTLGVALLAVSQQMYASAPTGDGYMETTDLRAMAVVARTWTLGDNWNVRWSYGMGPMYTEASMVIFPYSGPWPEDPMQTGIGASFVFESGVTLAREIFDHRWAITAGPQATLISQEMDSTGGETMARNQLELMFMLGARHRL